MVTVAPPQLETVTESAIALLIDRFYAAVRCDAVLGPVFEAAIEEAEWPEHLATMRRFWSSVMLTSGRYWASRPRARAEAARRPSATARSNAGPGIARRP